MSELIFNYAFFYKNNLTKTRAKLKKNNNFHFSEIILRKQYRIVTYGNPVSTIKTSGLYCFVNIAGTAAIYRNEKTLEYDIASDIRGLRENI